MRLSRRIRPVAGPFPACRMLDDGESDNGPSPVCPHAQQEESTEIHQRHA
jgi:hypothetical protein